MMAKYYPKSQIVTNLYAQNGESTTVNGTLLKSTDNSIYTGFFWTTSDGKYFSGKHPNDPPIVELILDRSNQSESKFSPTLPTSKTKTTIALFLNDPEVEIQGLAGPTESGNPNFGWSQYSILEYLRTQKIPFNNLPEYNNPYTNPVVPTEKDYQIGSFNRYFAKKRNAIQYIEIDKTMFNQLQNKVTTVVYYDYLSFQIPWTLTGDKDQVAQVNKNIVDLVVRTNNYLGFNQFLDHDYLKYYKQL